MLHSQRSSLPTKRALIFKHFARKGYALFSCIGREVRIGVLTVATLSSATAAMAQTTTTPQRTTAPTSKEDILLGEAEATGTRTPLATEQTARIVAVLTRTDIEQSPAQNVADLLKHFSGVDVRQRGAYGIQTDISIEGGTFDQISILLNGVAINNPQTGHLSMDLPVALDDIERVELLQGAASRVFGAQAFSGAINIVTRARHNTAQLRAQVGSFGTYGVGGAAGLTLGRGNYSLSASHDASDGATLNADFTQTRLFHQGGYAFRPLNVQWQVGHTAKAYGANTFYSPRFPNQWEENERTFVTLKAETKGKVRLTPTLAWQRSEDHFQLIRGTHTAENFHLVNVYEAGLNASHTWKAGTTTLGFNVRREEILSSNLGVPRDSARFKPVSYADGFYYTKSDARNNWSFFAEHNVVLHRWTLSAGAMALSNTSLADNALRFYPGVDVSYRPAEPLTLFASWNMAMRLPTFTDLFYKSPTHQGNTDLQAERTTNYRLGLRYRQGGVRASLQGFYMRGKDMIDWVMYTPTDTYHSAAFALNNMGFTADAHVSVKRILPMEVGVSYTYIHQERKDAQPIFKSSYALEYLRHKFTAEVRHRIVWPQLTATWQLRLQQREGNYLQWDATTKALATTPSPYPFVALVDARLQWQAPNYEVFVTANNLLGRRYFDLGNVPQPSTWVMAGAKWNIHW